MDEVTESDVTAFILAGGKSLRMGRDKAFVELGGQTLLGRALDVASVVTRDCRIVGDPAKFAVFGPVVEDIFRECGPLGGIHAALLSAKSELNLMLAVDLPFMKAKFLEYLIVQARETSAVVTVPHAGGGLQPLCAIYRRKFVEVAERALRKRKNKIDPLFAEVETRVLDEGELSRGGFSLDIFRNLNTLEHWEEAKEQVKLRQSFRTELKGG
jgi:molybdopterin-guanine dinucleotide biosynthesis protein A